MSEATNEQTMPKLLSHSYLIKVINYDPATGSFAWRIDIPKRIKAGMPAGSVSQNKKAIVINGENHAAHRLAWFYVRAEWPDGYVVPKNGNFLDLRWENLKLESRRDAAERTNLRHTSSSGVRGVSWNTRYKKWVASITINYRQVNLGTFDTIELAAAAYEDAKRNAPKADDVTLQQRRVEVANVARLRRAYKQTFDQNSNSMWSTFNAFAGDVSPMPVGGGWVIVPLDAASPIGPGNFTWARRAKYDKRTQEGRRSYTREWRNSNYDRHRVHGLRKSYGMELHEYQSMHDRQKGLCACCGRPESGLRGGYPINLAVDHDHEAGAIRALLCGDCNRGIGNFRDSPEIIRKAADYLEHHAKLALQEDDRRRVA